MRRTLQITLTLFCAAVVMVYTVVRSQTRAVVADAGLGVSTALSATAGNPVTVTSDGADLLQFAGLSWTRERVNWSQLEPIPGQRDWRALDRTVKQLRDRGVQIVGVIDGVPGWATPDSSDRYNGESALSPDPQALVAFVSEAAKRYSGTINYWEILPGADDLSRRVTALDVGEYARTLRAAAFAIHSANANAKVISGGINVTNFAYLQALIDSGVADSVDIIGVRAYIAPTQVESHLFGAEDLYLVHELLKLRNGKPIWVTEYGWGTGISIPEPSGMVNEETQADFLVTGAVLLRAAGAERVFWGSLKDQVPASFYGLIRAGKGQSDYSQRKPALVAMQVALQQLAGAETVGLVDTGERRVPLDFEYNDDQILGLWGVGQAFMTTVAVTDTFSYAGMRSLAVNYAFEYHDNPFAKRAPIVIQPEKQVAFAGTPRRVGMWVYGDGSQNKLSVLLTDARNETFQLPLGELEEGWHFMDVDIRGQMDASRAVFGMGNLEIDMPVVLDGFVIEHLEGSMFTQGTIFIDDVTTVSGPEIYAVRFKRGGSVVDVLRSTFPAEVNISSLSVGGTLIRRNGETSIVGNNNGKLSVGVGPSPVFLVHVVDRPPMTPVPQPTPRPELASGLMMTRPTPTIVPSPTMDPLASPVPPSATADPALSPTPGPSSSGRRAEPAYPALIDGQFADPAFGELWARSDMPIAAGAPNLVPRSWLWGRMLTGGTRETYDQGPGGYRLVQYFDKSRMEINNPSAARDAWYVTNGLLVVEMVDGRVQLADTAFEQRTPANEAIAGDPVEGNPNAPTYATLRSVAYPVVRDPAPRRSGATVTQTLTRDGNVRDDPALARYGITLEAYEETLGHNIPAVFMRFFNQQGVVYEAGGFMTGPVVRDWKFVMGLPISEPYWSRVRINGVEQDVLVQAFQRRVLTYTPANPQEWQVEMGNVGQHYLRWRYGK